MCSRKAERGCATDRALLQQLLRFPQPYVNLLRDSHRRSLTRLLSLSLIITAQA